MKKTLSSRIDPVPEEKVKVIVHLGTTDIAVEFLNGPTAGRTVTVSGSPHVVTTVMSLLRFVLVGTGTWEE